MNHGELLKELRTSKGMSQKELSEGISSQAALSRMEVSGNIPSYILIDYLQRLDVHPTEFFMITENSDFIDSKDFSKKFTLALFNKPQMEKLYQEEMAIYNNQHIPHRKLNAYRLKALYSFLHEEPLENCEEITRVLKNHLLNSQTWFISDVILYAQILFLFDRDFIRALHPKMIKSLEKLPFSASWQYTIAMTYAQITTNLAFRRDNMEDAAFYLKTFNLFMIEDSRSLAEKIYYSLYCKLLKLKLNFNKDDYQAMLTELEIFKTYGYDYDFNLMSRLINMTLKEYLVTN